MSRPFFGEMLRFLSALALGLMLLVPAVLAAAPGNAPPAPGGPQQATRRPGATTLQPGQPAPDFELPRLVIERDKEGKAVGKVSEDRGKLSSLSASAGAKPVCLIFSSYT